jgi:hypothetical protein
MAKLKMLEDLSPFSSSNGFINKLERQMAHKKDQGRCLYNIEMSIFYIRTIGRSTREEEDHCGLH